MISNFKPITVSHGSALTVARATQQVNGEWQFLGCQNSVTPEMIGYKFDTRDYVDELTSYVKLHKIRRHNAYATIMLYAGNSPVYLTPPLKGALNTRGNWVSAQGSEETRMMGLQDCRKKF